MAACGAKNFHKVNFDFSAVWLDFAGYSVRWIVLRPLSGVKADMTIALRNVR